jgi:glycosyltransferase involved in cell wall biosynthesis
MHEALGTSLLEAQSCGVPVLAFNTGGIPEALSQGKTGYLFDDFKILKEQLENVLTNKEKLNFFKQNARPFILEGFSVEKMLSDTEELYGNLVKE